MPSSLPSSMTPVASLERLKELHLDPAKFGSCSRPKYEDIPGRGKIIVNCGCDYEYDCEWAKVPMPDSPLIEDVDKPGTYVRQDPSVMRPRPRHVKTRLLKPSSSGQGDTIIESYCPCYAWHMGLKKRDGVNNEIARVIGGEGDTFLARGSKAKVEAGMPTVYVPWRSKMPIPSFPDPERMEELSEHIASAEARVEATNQDQEKRIQEGNRRMMVRDLSEDPATVISSRGDTIGAESGSSSA